MEKEDLDFLIELGKKMNEQNPRGTQNPMFIIKQKVRVYGESGCCNETERREDYDGDVCDSCQKLLDNDEELPDDCPYCDDECFVHFNWEDEAVEDTSAFFTAEAAQEHIDLNDYHYHKPFTYATGTWRNPEMRRLQNILAKLGGDKDSITYKL